MEKIISILDHQENFLLGNVFSYMLKTETVPII